MNNNTVKLNEKIVIDGKTYKPTNKKQLAYVKKLLSENADKIAQKNKEEMHNITATIQTYNDLNAIPITQSLLTETEIFAKNLLNTIPVNKYFRAKDITIAIKKHNNLTTEQKKLVNRLTWRLLHNKPQYKKIDNYHGVFQRVA